MLEVCTADVTAGLLLRLTWTPCASDQLHTIQVCYRDDGSLWKLGAGSFGTVFKAMKNGTTPVAVKVSTPVPSCCAMSVVWV